MSINQLTSKDLKRAITLLERKESYQAKIAEIDQELEALMGGEIPVPFHPASEGRKVRTGKRGALTAAVLEVIKNAGSQGIRLRDIAKAVGRRIGNINSWVQATGKKIKGIKKLSKGIYAWKG